MIMITTTTTTTTFTTTTTTTKENKKQQKPKVQNYSQLQMNCHFLTRDPGTPGEVESMEEPEMFGDHLHPIVRDFAASRQVQ